MNEPPHFTDDGTTLSFHCPDGQANVVIATRLVREIVSEINRLRSIVDGAQTAERKDACDAKPPPESGRI